MDKKQNCINVDDLSDKFSKFGLFQSYQYVLICLPILFAAMMNVNYIFVAAEVRHRCLVPECEASMPTVERPLWWPDGTNEQCLQPVIDKNELSHNGICTNKSFVGQVRNCEAWVYESNDTIAAELNLACQTWKLNLIGSIHNGGMIVSMILMGWLSDTFGRKPTLTICAVCGVVGVIKCFVNNFYAFLAVELCESILSSGILTVAIVLMIEIGGQNKRVLAGVLFSYGFYVGESIFAVIAMLVPYWKHLVLCVYIPPIFFISYIYLLKESVRWQMLKGKYKEAKSTLILAAKMNKIDISTKKLKEMTDNEFKNKFNLQTIKSDKEHFKDILYSKEILRRLLVTAYCFFASGFIYYGFTIHSVLLPGSKHTNFILASITSFPGDLLAFFTFDKYGRKISLMCGFFSCSIFCVATEFSPSSLPWVKILLFLCGKVSIALCFTGIYTYSLELFPTSIRGSMVSCGNTAARVGSMLAPLTPLLISQMKALPAILFASAGIVAGIFLLFTPETRDLELTDTIAQVEKMQSHKEPTTRTNH